jgi:hypothetical protein
MHIFVDESGVFAQSTSGTTSVCVLAALIAPDPSVSLLQGGFERLAESWGINTREVKGRNLDETQFQAVHDLLAKYDTILTLVAIDLGTHTEDMITRHRLNQAARMTKHFGPEHHPNLLAEVKEIATRIEKLPDQLYVQMVLLTHLINSVLQLAIVHYPQTSPPELGRFAWRLDAKSDKQTEYEELWKILVAPFAQSQSIRQPMLFIRGADYSAFSKFENPDLLSPPEHLRSHLRNPNAVFSTFDIKKVMLEDLVFTDSKAGRGLQLADVLANCFRRACNNRLQPAGWLGLTKLLMKDPRSGQAIQFYQLLTTPFERRIKDMPYGDVVIALEAGARSCVLDQN